MHGKHLQLSSDFLYVESHSAPKHMLGSQTVEKIVQHYPEGHLPYVTLDTSWNKEDCHDFPRFFLVLYYMKHFM